MPPTSSAPDDSTTAANSSADPANHFLNVGILKDDNSPCGTSYLVSHFYYGVSIKLRGGDIEAFSRHGGTVPVPGITRWAADAITLADATRIWRNREQISSVVAAHGNEARLSVTFTEGRIHIREYDFNLWSVEVPEASRPRIPEQPTCTQHGTSPA